MRHISRLSFDRTPTHTPQFTHTLTAIGNWAHLSSILCLRDTLVLAENRDFLFVVSIFDGIRVLTCFNGYSLSLPLSNLQQLRSSSMSMSGFFLFFHFSTTAVHPVSFLHSNTLCNSFWLFLYNMQVSSHECFLLTFWRPNCPLVQRMSSVSHFRQMIQTTHGRRQLFFQRFLHSRKFVP